MADEAKTGDIGLGPVEAMDVALIQGFAGQILNTLHEMNLDQLKQFSILTTAFVNQMKNMLRTSPSEQFESNKRTVLELLYQVHQDVRKIEFGAPANARQSQDGPPAKGPDRTSN